MTDPTHLRITAGPLTFTARLELERAPKTCAAFIERLPFANHLRHVRWSGEATWIALGDTDFGLGFENHTRHPAPGHILLFPGPYSETEILFPYGATSFASVVGPLAGNHFLTVVDGLDDLPRLGELTSWHGAQPITFEACEPGEPAGDPGHDPNLSPAA